VLQNPSLEDKPYPTDINLFFRASRFSSSSTRIKSITPPPPMASVMIPPSLVSRSRNKFIWWIDPSAEAAKNSRSVTSQAKCEIGRGKWKVVNNALDERSQSYQRNQVRGGRKHFKLRTLTVWSTAEVKILQSGKGPIPHMISVTERVWSGRVQYGTNGSF